ncbi:MAG: hypothetical protein GY718_07330 [Lentisphaerae bacterium]|nr:hypothetical protein [Lentisphaerota bacterium]
MGISLAGLTLVRAEGSLVIPVIMIGLAVLLFVNEKCNFNKQFILKTFTALFITGIIFLCALAPRLIQSYIHFGVPFADARQASYIGRVTNLKLNTTWENINSPKPFPRIKYKHFASEQKRSNPFFSLKRLIKFLECFGRGAYEFYLALAIAGLFFWKKYCKNFTAEYCIIAAATLLYCLVYYSTSISYRYFTFVLLFLMPLSLIGGKEAVLFLSRRIKEKYLNPVLLIAFLAISFGQVGNGIAKLIRHKYDQGLY